MGVRTPPKTNPPPTAALTTNNRAIIDEKLYQVTYRNHDQAHHLPAIINSNA